MPDLPEQLSPKAARILTAASDLLVSRGFKGVTIAEVAQRAHIGKGTVYLYWKTKDDLILGLVARTLIGFADSLIEQLVAAPERARPSLFCSDVVRRSAAGPLVAAHRDRNDDLLGSMARDPRMLELHDTLGPVAVLHAVLPAWRRAGLAHNDVPLSDQALSLHMLTLGAALVLSQPGSATHNSETDTDTVRIYARSVTALLGPEEGSDDQVRSAAQNIIDALDHLRSRTYRLVTPEA